MLTTKRLILRGWRDEDIETFARHNQDPRVMRYFPSPLSRVQTQECVNRWRTCLKEHGFCFFAVEARATGAFVGVIGLGIPTWDAHFTPCVEVGWRLDPEVWGRGYATEGARACIAYAFDLGRSEVVALTAEANQPSRAVMERMHMQRNPSDDFIHPSVEPDSELSRHVLYRIDRSGFVSRFGADGHYGRSDLPPPVRDPGD